MKKAVLLAALLSSIASAECPPLTGTFLCRATDSKLPGSVKDFAQDDEGPITHYTLKSNLEGQPAATVEYRTDGQVQKRTETSGSRTLTLTEAAICQEGRFVIKGNMPVPVGGVLFYEHRFNLTASGDLSVRSIAEIKGIGGSDDTKVCTRQP